MKYKILMPALLLVLIVAGWRWFAANTAPDVAFVSLNSGQGETVALRSLRGHPVLVSFWASDCPACLQEMPDFSALHRDYAARGFHLIAVAMRYDPPNRVLELAKQLPYVVTLDPTGAIAEAFGPVQLVPESFLIAPDGRIVLHTLGRLEASTVRPILDRLLGES